ncbi:CHASE2 domain-containing protein [Hydrogenophaga aquatica]
MKKLSLRAMAALLALGSVGLGLLLLLLDPLLLQTLRHQGFDQYQRWQPRPYAEAPVRIIDIDEASLERLGQWPWPRTRIAELVQRVGEAGAAALAFDVVFAEPDRTSPRTVSALWPLPPAARDALAALPDHDEVLAAALRENDVVLGFAVQRDQDPQAGERLPSAPYRHVWVGGGPALDALHGFTTAVPPLPVLDTAAKGMGALTFVPDADGVVRRVPLVLRLADQPVPSLSAEALRVGQGASNHLLRSAEGGAAALEEVRVGDVTIPTTAQGEMWVHYSAPVPERYVPAWRVLTGEVDPALLAGNLVLVGSSAQGLMDLRFNPLGRVMPGVEAHAQALEQALTGHFLTRPHWALALEVVTVVAGGVAVVVLATHVSALLAAAGAALLVGAVLWGGWWAFSAHGLLVNSFTPALVLALSFVAASLARHFWSERQQRWIKDAFSRYVSPNRVEYLVNHPDALELGGKRQTCSFVFTDLAGFTTLMEKIDPAEALVLLNRYLEEMIAIAFRHQGTLDRIVGDAVAIMFSAPVPQPDHAQRALDCALEMHAFASRYAIDLQARGIPFGHTRLGIHSGEVIVGNFGGGAVFDYRALGDPVNTASRLEGVNKYLGTLICVSGVTLSACTGVKARAVGRLVLKGKSEALAVYEPLPEPMEGGYAPLPDYETAYMALADGRDEAADLFAALHRHYPDDPLVHLHHERLARGELGDRLVFEGK